MGNEGISRRRLIEGAATLVSLIGGKKALASVERKPDSLLPKITSQPIDQRVRVFVDAFFAETPYIELIHEMNRFGIGDVFAEAFVDTLYKLNEEKNTDGSAHFRNAFEMMAFQEFAVRVLHSMRETQAVDDLFENDFVIRLRVLRMLQDISKEAGKMILSDDAKELQR